MAHNDDEHFATLHMERAKRARVAGRASDNEDATPMLVTERRRVRCGGVWRRCRVALRVAVAATILVAATASTTSSSGSASEEPLESRLAQTPMNDSNVIRVPIGLQFLGSVNESLGVNGTADSNDTITKRWTCKQSDPITEYEVAWFDEADGTVAGTQVVAHTPGSLVLTSTGAPNGSTGAQDLVPTTAIVTQLRNGRSYTFKVRAKNKNGFSTWSAKSLAVSPLHPPDLCGRVTCSGHGTCFPTYQPDASINRELAVTADAAASTDGQCICRPGFNPPDCSVKNEELKYVWKVTEWGQCNSGCGGGKRTREAICFDVALDAQAAADSFCVDKKPSLTRICNGMECGSKLVSVKYVVEMSYDEVLFSPEAWDAFELAFTTEVSAALQIPRTRIEVTSIKRGSIAVYFQILPASRVGEQSLNDIVELLQDELGNATSTLRSKGTFARRIEPNGVKLSFSIADQTVAGGAEDISVIGLIGTVIVLCSFVALFGWFLRKRYERIMKRLAEAEEPKHVLGATKSDMKRMGIRTMA